MNYKTTIGGAVSSLGSSLIGIGILPQFSSGVSDEQKAFLWYAAVAGYIINIIGKFLTSLFAADAAELARIKEQVNVTTPPVP